MKFSAPYKSVLLVWLLSVLGTAVSAQSSSISGVVNIYTDVISINFCNYQLTVGNASGFEADDTVLIIQMKGAGFETTNNASFGGITNYNEAGNYELAVIQSISGNTVRLYSMIRNYNTAGRVQMVSVPQYQDVTVTATLTCQPWNGTTGGVLIFQAQNTVTLSANISVSNHGFRGGANASVGGNCASTAFFYNCTSGNGANKGEGIAEYTCAHGRGKGPIGNAGGGGNGHNNGGAGGGNGGAGGDGGCYRDCCNGGLKGNALLFSNAENRIFPGGGGGAGHANNNSVVPGGNGGGIVIITANNLEGNGFSIFANGQNGATAGDIDGAAGAGAGGIVLLDVNNYASTVNVSANGGTGGNIAVNSPHGPGGGGGGGCVWIKNNAVSPNIIPQVNGGPSGLYQGDPRSSQPGSAGVVLTDLQVPFSLNAVPPLTVSGVTTNVSCNGANNGSVTVTAQGGRTPYTYKWSNGSASDAPVNLAPGIHNVTVYDVCNDSATTSFTITQPLPLQSSAVVTDETCIPGANGNINLSVSGGTSPYRFLWSNSDTTEDISGLLAGLYEITITDSAGCRLVDTLTIALINNMPQVSLGADATACPGDTITLQPSVFGDAYQWQNGNTDSFFQVTAAGVYWVDVFFGSCQTRDSAIIAFDVPFQPDLGNDTALCAGDSLLLYAGAGSFGYVWQDGSTASTFTAPAGGIYSVQVTAGTCLRSDTVEIISNPIPTVHLGNDSSLCAGDILVLNAGNYDSYLWQDGTADPTHSVSTPGTYWVQVMENNCPAGDSIEINYDTPPRFSLGADTTLCAGQTLQLAASDGDHYTWQDGSNNPGYTVTNAGTYSVTVLKGVCTGADSIEVFFDPPVVFSLGNDTLLCDVQTYLLDVSATSGTYQWQDGSAASSFEVTEPGTYSVSINAGSCSASDTIEIDFDQFPQVSVLPQDTTVCAGESVGLTVQSATADYVWSTGSEAATLLTDTTGLFWVMATNRCGSVYDTANVVVDNCTLFVPNAFTPNGDGMNDVFFPIFTNDIYATDYLFQVFDRWGELLFESGDKQTGWDGTYRGKLLLPGVYVYQIVTGRDGRLSTRHKGSVTLIR